jgi:carbon-monoxide dehydrogenase medium subunit
MCLRLARPAHLVDLGGVDELRRLDVRDGVLTIGGCVRQRAAERSPDVPRACPLLAQAVPLVGHLQIRSRGTIGGSVAHADPAAELPLVTLVLDAMLVARSIRGAREIPASSFFESAFTTALEPDELLAAVRFPTPAPGARGAFREFSRRHGDFAVVGVAAYVNSGPDGRIVDARLGFSGVDSTPVRVAEAEAMLVGAEPSPDLLQAVAQAAAKNLEPSSDLHGSSGYRRHLAVVLARRALEDATTGERN